MDRLQIETKFISGDAGAIEALAWPFATADRVGDMIKKGAFAGVQLPMPMLFGHDQGEPIGVWDHAEERADGFYVKGRLLVGEVKRADEVHALIKAGAVRGISIGFTGATGQRRQPRGRNITDLKLMEVSLVTIPCHPGARVTSAKDAVGALRLTAALQRATAQLAAR